MLVELPQNRNGKRALLGDLVCAWVGVCSCFLVFKGLGAGRGGLCVIVLFLVVFGGGFKGLGGEIIDVKTSVRVSRQECRHHNFRSSGLSKQGLIFFCATDMVAPNHGTQGVSVRVCAQQCWHLKPLCLRCQTFQRHNISEGKHQLSNYHNKAPPPLGYFPCIPYAPKTQIVQKAGQLGLITTRFAPLSFVLSTHPAS